MFIKTQDGGICNLALCTDIVHNVSSSRVLAVFNGDENPQSEKVILKLTGLKMLGRIPETSTIDKHFIQSQASTFSNL